MTTTTAMAMTMMKHCDYNDCKDDDQADDGDDDNDYFDNADSDGCGCQFYRARNTRQPIPTASPSKPIFPKPTSTKSHLPKLHLCQNPPLQKPIFQNPPPPKPISPKIHLLQNPHHPEPASTKTHLTQNPHH